MEHYGIRQHAPAGVTLDAGQVRAAGAVAGYSPVFDRD